MDIVSYPFWLSYNQRSDLSPFASTGLLVGIIKHSVVAIGDGSKGHKRQVHPAGQRGSITARTTALGRARISLAFGTIPLR